MNDIDELKIREYAQNGTLLYFAVEKLGGEMRLPLAEIERRVGQHVLVKAALSDDGSEIIITSTCKVTP